MAPITTYSLRDLDLSLGQAERADLELELVGYRQGGFLYAPDPYPVPARLDTTLMTSGWDFRLRFDTDLLGPCARCLEDAKVPISVDVHEVHDSDADADELRSDFVNDDEQTLDIAGWAQELIGLSFPTKVLCKPTCEGLCPQCGTNWNEGSCDCVPPSGDPRWDKLRELKLDEE